MPPPISSQSGSKAALITWTVLTSILFVVATVLAIFAHVDRNKIALDMQTMQKKYGEVISDTDLAGELKNNLANIKKSDETLYPSDLKLINVALQQRDNLVRKIAGAQASDDSVALSRADDALKAASAVEGTKVSNDSLLSAVTSLTSELKRSQDELKSTNEARDAIQAKLAAVDESIKTQLAAKDKDIKAAREEASKYQTDINDERGNKDKQIIDIQTQSETASKAAQDDLTKLQAQQQEMTIQHNKLEAQIKALQGKLRDVRQGVDQIARQADARIMRTGGGGVVYIDLGAGDQVSAGMSFEVFDRIEGIPKPGDPISDEALPKGKASIEIVRVSPGASECRVVRINPGSTIVEGDLCVNLVYDKSTKYNFLVYGNFDLDRNNLPTPQDADVIKRLVTSWGGNVTDKLTVDTDFVVLGRVPELPSYTQEELDRPEIQFEVEKKKQEIAAYDETLARAIELNIPVLNQNRFLYFVGYFQQSAR